MIKLPKEVTELLDGANTIQEESWLNFNSEIDGLPVVQMTLRHYFILVGVESPFLNGKEYELADLGIFLWLLSPDFELGEKNRDAYCKKVAKLNLVKAIADLEKYLEHTFFDADTADVKPKKRYANFVAYQIDTYAKEYGWSVAETMNMPLRQIFQLNTAIAERYAEQAGEKYTKLRNIDMVEAQAVLDQFRNQRMKN